MAVMMRSFLMTANSMMIVTVVPEGERWCWSNNITLSQITICSLLLQCSILSYNVTYNIKIQSWSARSPLVSLAPPHQSLSPRTPTAGPSTHRCGACGGCSRMGQCSDKGWVRAMIFIARGWGVGSNETGEGEDGFLGQKVKVGSQYNSTILNIKLFMSVKQDSKQC